MPKLSLGNRPLSRASAIVNRMRCCWGVSWGKRWHALGRRSDVVVFSAEKRQSLPLPSFCAQIGDLLITYAPTRCPFGRCALFTDREGSRVPRGQAPAALASGRVYCDESARRLRMAHPTRAAFREWCRPLRPNYAWSIQHEWAAHLLLLEIDLACCDHRLLAIGGRRASRGAHVHARNPVAIQIMVDTGQARTGRLGE
jgi:hypothetical protein